jgi:hypothetical protein
LFLNVFDFSKNLFQNLVRRGVRGGVVWEHESQRKNCKFEFKYFAKVLKFFSLFSHKMPFFDKKYIEILWSGGEHSAM